MKRSWSSSALYVGFLFALGSSLASCKTLEPDVPLTPRPTAVQEKSLVVDTVKASGPVVQDLKRLVDRSAADAFAKTFGNSGAEVEYSGGVNCFKNGCLIEVTYRDVCTEKASTDRLRNFPVPLRSWPGIIYHSPPVMLAGGKVQVTWALLLPDLAADDNRGRFQRFAEGKMIDASIRPDVCSSPNTGTAQPAPNQGVK
jgi:hypothetical protein